MAIQSALESEIGWVGVMTVKNQRFEVAKLNTHSAVETVLGMGQQTLTIHIHGERHD